VRSLRVDSASFGKIETTVRHAPGNADNQAAGDAQNGGEGRVTDGLRLMP
jgi:hypothetical protein